MPPHPNRFSLSTAQALAGFTLSKAAEGRSAKTLADYGYSIGMLVAWLQGQGRGEIPVADLETDDLRRFLAHLQQPGRRLSPKTVKNVHTALRSFWSWLSSEFGLPHLVKPIAAPKAHPPALRLPSREDIQRLLKACDQTAPARARARQAFSMRRPTALRDRAIIMVLLDTGLRGGELCGLALGDLDLHTGSLLVRHGKGGRQRMVYVGKATGRAVWRCLAGQRQGAKPGDPLFLTCQGRPLSVDHLSGLVAGLGRRAGVKISPHVLRHAFATEFLRGGGNLLALRRLMGHVSPAMLERYVQLSEVDLQQAHASASPADRWRL